jgi:hypothetical protein
MVTYTITAFSIMYLCLFCAGFLIYGMHYRAGVAAARAIILASQFCGILSAILAVRHLIGLLYL